MPTPKKGPRLASSPAHERLMLANMATSLFENGRIVTTLPKAKRLRPLAERLITFAKKGDLASRRRVMRVIRNKSVVHKLFTEIAEQMQQREGGYTRIIKIAPSKGNNAPRAIIELVTEPVSAKQSVVKEAQTAADVAADKAEVKKTEAKEAEVAADVAADEAQVEEAKAKDNRGKDEVAADVAADEAEVKETEAKEATAEAKEAQVDQDVADDEVQVEKAE
ncbi:large subunit ribosomal protein L17 [Bifidobacterium bohemicum]|uniref:Large ribosomal subunit protein bL17 n=1 Tax=Bifidobacterium bohemicum DSM 22767 TaxID=1437606 RepID=A0A086ZEE7_9BIFI|nr:50S ribosomal protein L17 [Bifidobacterium bohemicum]KFI44897.1 50S ribosomal protein L17 [Bifidobacterium bohemicum DSM 22767]SCB96753.1 large subunit ribosomal protein L17 [Bifidobacterium bohemicum]